MTNPLEESTYQVTADNTLITRGETVTAHVITTNILDGTILYWGTSGAANPADFTDNVLNGSCIIYNNIATIVRQTTVNLYPAGSTSFVINLYLTQMRKVSYTESVTAHSAESIALINYRLQNILTRAYFYTANLSEYNSMIRGGEWEGSNISFFLLQGPNELNNLQPAL